MPGDTQARSLSFELDLFGRTPAEQVYDITITRKPEARAARYSRTRTVHRRVPTAAQVFADPLRHGVEHVLSGADHLLFLLVVLASLAGANGGWWRALGALTCFTVGHALSLAAGAWGFVSVSPALVETGIAVTMQGTRDRSPSHAVLDRWRPSSNSAPCLSMRPRGRQPQLDAYFIANKNNVIYNRLSELEFCAVHTPFPHGCCRFRGANRGSGSL